MLLAAITITVVGIALFLTVYHYIVELIARGSEGRKITYRTAFWITYLLSPIIGFLVIYASPKEQIENQINSLSSADELLKLGELLEKGLITRQEFDVQKSKLLK